MSSASLGSDTGAKGIDGNWNEPFSMNDIMIVVRERVSRYLSTPRNAISICPVSAGRHARCCPPAGEDVPNFGSRTCLQVCPQSVPYLVSLND